MPRQFREGLKLGMPCRNDLNIKLPAINSSRHSDATSQGEEEQQLKTRSKANTTSLHIVYDSENKNLLPYPDGEIIRTPSPEHLGIPAGPMKMMRRYSKRDEEYTSDDSLMAAPSLKVPPSLRRKAKVAIK